MWPHTIAILIGGQSSRMGVPKHGVVLPNGVTMLDTMISFAKHTAQKLVIVGGEVDGYESIPDQRYQVGPVAGIEALLASNLDQQYLVVGCDMPRLQTSDVQPLLLCQGNAVFYFNNQTLPLPLKINQEMHSTCTAYLDNSGRSMKGFIAQCPHASVRIELDNLDKVTSLNSPEDISKMFG